GLWSPPSPFFFAAQSHFRGSIFPKLLKRGFWQYFLVSAQSFFSTVFNRDHNYPPFLSLLNGTEYPGAPYSMSAVEFTPPELQLVYLNYDFRPADLSDTLVKS
ncbi:hypothetical protein PAPHI01_2031, partial [Pancytospora philotis]